MYNAKFIIPGLVVAVALFTAPFWLSASSGPYSYPKLALPTGADAAVCIEPVEVMRAQHMALLNTWRDEAVRLEKRVYVASDGKQWDISLQKTCMACHADKAAFCDTCHNSNNVQPYCWDCHVAPASVAGTTAGGNQ